MSEMIKNFSQMLNNQQIPDNIKNVLNSMNMNNNMSSNNDASKNNTSNNATNSKGKSDNKYNNVKNSNGFNNSKDNTVKNKGFNTESFSDNSDSDSSSSTNTSGFNNIFGDLDINTILKIQKVMSSINNDKQNDSRTNLLMSLKPYLKDSRKSKIDQYVQLMKMGKVFEIINPLGGDKKNV